MIGEQATHRVSLMVEAAEIVRGIAAGSDDTESLIPAIGCVSHGSGDRPRKIIAGLDNPDCGG